MDIWQKGRAELTEELKNICDRIETNLAAELDPENNAFIPREKLKSLRDRAAKAGELEDEVSSALAGKTAELRRLAEDKAQLTEQLRTQKDVSSRVDGLEKENERLAAEVKHLSHNALGAEVAAGGSATSTPRPSASEIPSSESRIDLNGFQVIAKDTYEALVKKFNRVYENNRLLMSAREKLERALTERKDKYRENYEILDKRVKKREATIKQQKEELQQLKAQLHITGESRTSSTPVPEQAREQNDLTVPTDQDGPALPTELPVALPDGDIGNNQRVVDTEFLAPEPSTTSDLTSFSSPNDRIDPEVKEECFKDAPLSPDTPVVLSSRRVRKTKSRKETTELCNASEIVKTEIVSSSPIGLAAILDLDESLDLDDTGDNQSTPRKGRPFLQQALRTSPSPANATPDETKTPRIIDYHDSISFPLSLSTPMRRGGVKRPSSVLQPRSPNTRILPRTSGETVPKRRRIRNDEALNDLLEDGQVLQSILNSSTRYTPTYEQARMLPDLLAKPSPPKPVLTSTRLAATQPKPRHVGGGSAVSSRAYEIFQEDSLKIANFGPPISQDPVRSTGSAEPPGPTSMGSVPSSKYTSRSSGLSIEALSPASKSPSRDSTYDSRPKSKDLLEKRLEISTPPQPALTTPVHAQRSPSRNKPTASVKSPRPSCRGSARQRKTLKSAVQTAKTHSEDQYATLSRIGSPPLRARPLEELALQDFKVNPKYNQGYSYAFREVVRKQADRRCLPGCTKPDCCGGQFRALAEATRDPTKIPTASQEEADERILNEFLGDNSYKLVNMSEIERHEILIQALTRDMSNRIGKHRHAYERRQSPPGYWRSDFPNTQEEVQDRVKARQLENEQLVHRYEEAMRGGAYIFRDE